MVGFKSDKQRKGFFASRGNPRSNVTPQMTRQKKIDVDKIRVSEAEMKEELKSISNTQLQQMIKTEVRPMNLKRLLKENKRRIQQEKEMREARRFDARRRIR